MTTTKITRKANTKMMIHALQNPTSQIHGIAVGTKNTIQDVLPVCHSAPTKPMLDMAFRLADSYLVSSDSDAIVMANERLNDSNPNQVSLRIMSMIGSKVPEGEEAVLLQVNTNSSTTSLQLYGKDSRNNWSRPYAAEDVTLECNPNGEEIVRMMEEATCFDFEDHLDACNEEEIVERDWIVNCAIEKLISTHA